MEDLVRLCADHAAYEKAEYDPDGKRELLTETLFGQNPPVHCLVVEIAPRLVGYATFGPQYATWLADKYLYLDCLFIDAEFRGFGIGQQMMKSIQTQAAQLGCREVQWQTPEFNSDAIRFYDRLPQASRSHKFRYVWSVQTASIQPIQ